MYCELCGCFCVCCLQFEDACSECDAAKPYFLEWDGEVDGDVFQGQDGGL